MERGKEFRSLLDTCSQEPTFERFFFALRKGFLPWLLGAGRKVVVHMHWLTFDFGVNLSNIYMNSCIREFYHTGDTRKCTTYLFFFARLFETYWVLTYMILYL